jgi:hypothetical protein
MQTATRLAGSSSWVAQYVEFILTTSALVAIACKCLLSQSHGDNATPRACRSLELGSWKQLRGMGSAK